MDAVTSAVKAAIDALTNAAIRQAGVFDWAPTFVVLGESKCGKSTLVNRISRAAVVSADAVDATVGTTRVRTRIHGVQGAMDVPVVYLVDVAPIQTTHDLERHLASVEAADAALWCVPAQHGHTADVVGQWRAMPPTLRANTLVVVTRTDQLAPDEVSRVLERVGRAAVADGLLGAAAVSSAWGPATAVGGDVAKHLFAMASSAVTHRVAARRAEIETLGAIAVATLVPAASEPSVRAEGGRSPTRDYRGDERRLLGNLKAGRLRLRVLLFREWSLSVGRNGSGWLDARVVGPRGFTVESPAARFALHQEDSSHGSWIHLSSGFQPLFGLDFHPVPNEQPHSRWSRVASIEVQVASGGLVLVTIQKGVSCEQYNTTWEVESEP